MPISVEVEPTDGIAIVSATGDLTRRDAEGAAAALWKTPYWDGQIAVWNFEEARFDLSPADARSIARFVLEHQPSPPPRRMAFVTPRDVDFGMARIFEVFRQDEATDFRVFREFEEALAWARAVAGDVR